jgi:ABC-type xylose transport system permease subunit
MRALELGELGFAAVIVLTYVAALGVRRRSRREAVEVDTVPEASVAAVLAAIALAAIMFGLVWARFLVDFGVGLLVVALARLVLEVRAEREARQ